MDKLDTPWVTGTGIGRQPAAIERADVARIVTAAEKRMKQGRYGTHEGRRKVAQ